jgi:hypothetical protein
MWSLRVRVKQRGKTENHTVQADPAEPLAQLVEKIRTCAGIGARRKIALAHGYPPQILAISSSSLCKPLGSSGLANSESINVQFPSAEADGASASTTASAASTAAAMSATTSQTNAKDKARKGRPKRSATTNQSRSAGAARAGVATLGSRAKRPRSKAAWAKLGGGNVLEASVEAAAAAASAAPLDASAKKDDKAVAAVKRQQSVRHTMDAALLQAAISMNGGDTDNNHSNADKEDALVGFFRTSLKDRVAQQYQDTLATSRHKAALAGLYKFSEKHDEGQRLGGGDVETISTLHAPLALLLRPMVVEFKQEVGGWTQEEFNLIPENMLRVSIQTLANDRQLVASDDDSTPSRCARDCLRAYEMSKSARMFWSLVHLHGGDVRTGLGRLLPDEDWSDLDSRKRELSAKAKYNLNQEAMLKKARQEEEEEEADDDVASNSDNNNQTSTASLATDDVGNATQDKEDEGATGATEQAIEGPEEEEKVVLSDVVEDEAAQTWLLNTFGASTVDELANLDVEAVKQAIGNSSNINTAATPGADVESAAVAVVAGERRRWWVG